ncbi:S1/P1 nuclease [Tahibacter amnicola]|uniref:S1/P1 nuclease n=1 Tax=Tahibacter amnicola TaxID=2976241 RepID=A0ABY6BFT6_9GAMM|nr:S1/P1 nuclease [Tahibacter amnicola]UXI68886.1 S1/P1 nuclease [Tahibacter amnicola]
MFLLSPAAWAWGPVGHRTVAKLAEDQLSPAAKTQVVSLLAPDNERTLVDIAVWADDLRDTDPARFRTTSRQHYVNIRSDTCRFDAGRDCAGGECVVIAIRRNTDILKDKRRSREERADALRFVVHFVGDVHQPLHASYRSDKGGNEEQVRVGRDTRNLHSVWDSIMLDSTGLSWSQYAKKLTLQRALVERDNALRPDLWAQESCSIVRDGDIYPDKRKVDDTYFDRHLPQAERRLREAGNRLAHLINTALQ